MSKTTVREAHKKLRHHKARLALYKFLWEAMYGDKLPLRQMPTEFGSVYGNTDYDKYITEQLHILLGIKKPWWKRLLGL